MKSYIINKVSAGRTLGRYLEKILPGAPGSFVYKALRNNKIKVNGKKPADLKLKLEEGDEVKLFLTDEQFDDFGESKQTQSTLSVNPHFLKVAYEDENMVIFIKPAGVLSQKDESGVLSANEYGLAYLKEKGITASAEFTPGVLNRLDRNTSGLILMAKNVMSAQCLSEIIADKSLGKYYLAVVDGVVQWDKKDLQAFWKKNEETNTVYVSTDETEGGKNISLSAQCLIRGENSSVLEVRLLTGKSHQIRAQLSSVDHPIIGDRKYGYVGPEKNLMLCAYKLVFPSCPTPLEYMNGKTVEIKPPVFFNSYLK